MKAFSLLLPVLFWNRLTGCATTEPLKGRADLLDFLTDGKATRAEVLLPLPDDELLALDEALDRLALVGPRAAERVKLCFFVGLPQEQAAKHLGASILTVERTWAYARMAVSRDSRL